MASIATIWSYLSNQYTVMHHIMVFQSTTDYIYESDPIRLQWGWKIPIT